MAIAGAKVAHFATGQAKFQRTYEQLIEQYGVRKLRGFRTEKSFDDAEHVFCHLDLLFRIETDPELLAAYRVVADGLWEHFRGDAQSLFAYIYYNLAPDAPGREEALADALRSLRTWPTDMTLRPRMNSLDASRKPPYPTYLAAWDNEYIWKGNLLRADGWLSRPVVDVAVSAEDPAVIYAVEQAGALYQSRDGAASWQQWRPVDETLQQHVLAVDVGTRSRIVAVATTSGYYLSTTAGARWERLPVPDEIGRPVDILFDPGQAEVLYAVGAQGVARSRDFGPEYLGQSWEVLSRELPPLDAPQFVVCPGKAGRVYARSGSRLFQRRLDQEGWQRAAEMGIGEYGALYPWLVVNPANPEHVVVGIQVSYERLGKLSLLQQSLDAGRTWSNTLESLYRRLQEGGLASLVFLTVPGELRQLAIDPQDPRVFYATADRGVRVSTDGGASWSDASQGLEIPLVNALVRPAVGNAVFASTPGGLYVSSDRGARWRDAHLWLQFTKNTRRELGGASFIDAYWRARYYGMIDDQTALAPIDRP
jgi:photosystem II stability/assembly factor-like uncharacterized protein